MAEKKVKRVVLNGETLIDLTADTVAEEYVVKGITFHGRDGGIYSGNYKPNIKALTITDNGVYPVEDLVDGYGPITVEVTAGTVDPSMKPTLLPPTLTINDSTETLTISDTRNDNHVQEYDLYFDGTYFMTVRHKSILLPAYATLSDTVAIQAIAKSENFNNSIRSNIVLWRYKEPAQPSQGSALYTPNIVVNGARKTLVVKSGDNNTASYTGGYHIYCNGEKVTSISFAERAKEIDISDWLDENEEQYFQAQAYRTESQTQYARDSALSTKKYVYYPNVGTEGLKYTLVSSTEDPYYTCDGIGTATETNIIIPSYYGENNYPVREIKASAFSNNTTLTGVVFSNMLEKINDSAFYQCSKITTITFSDTISSIGDSAFYSCSQISGEILFPRDITSIGSGSFGYCSNITLLDFSKREGKINYYQSFYSTSKLTTLKMGKAYLYFSGTDYDGGSYTCAFGGVTKVYFDSIDSLLKCYYGSYGYVGNPFSSYSGNYRNGTYYINDEPLTSVSVPDSITTIPAGIFRSYKNITTVDLNKVTSIGNYAFRDSSVQQIVTSRALKTIGNSAFLNCSSLRFFDFKDGLLSIGNYAFQNCTQLEFDSLPNSITSLGSGAFYSCTSLQEIALPNSIATLSDRAFYGCTQLQQINIPILVSVLNDSTFYNCTSLQEIAFPWGLKQINTYVFYNCTSLHTLTMGEGVASLGSYAFSGCTSLKNINFSYRLVNIGSYCFLNCSSLEEITLPEGVSELGIQAFKGCTALQKMVVPKNTSTIGASCFEGCTSLTEIIIQKNVNTIGDAFLKGADALEKIEVAEDNLDYYSENNVLYTYDKKTLIVAAKADTTEKLELPEGVEIITSYAFEKAKFGEVIPKEGLKTIQSYAFSQAELTKFEFVSTITTIQTYAFSQCQNLLNAELPDDISSLGTYAFNKCASLKSASMGKILKSVPSYCYYNCQELESFTFSPQTTTINDYAFYNCKKIDNFSLPETIITIGNYGLYYCGRQDYLNLPNLTSVGQYAFSRMKIGTMNLPLLTTYATYLFRYCSFDYLDTGDIVATTLPTYCFADTIIDTLYIRPNITSYGTYCFYQSVVDTMYLLGTKQSYSSNCWTSLSLNKIYIQDFSNWLVTTSNEYFSNAKEKYVIDENLEEVFDITITTNSSWTSGKTKNLKHIKKLTLTNAYLWYGNNAFSGCESLEEFNYDSENMNSSVNWTQNSTSGGTTTYTYLSTFKGMGDPEKGVILKIGPSVKGLPQQFINENDNFVKVDLSEAETLTTLAEQAFYGSKKLEEIILGSVLTALPNYAIYNCQQLKKCDLPDNIKTLGNYAFASSYALPEIDLNQVTSIGTHCFQACYSLQKVYYSKAMTTIPNYAFYQCYGLKEIEFFTDITAINQYGFAYCYNLRSFNIPETVTSVGNYAFYYCSGLQRIIVGEKVSSIGSYAFQYCNKLFEVINKSALVLKIGNSSYGYVAYYAKQILSSEDETIFEQEGEFEYYQDETSCILMRRLGTDTNMVLPDKLGGQEYVLSSYAFAADNYLETFVLPSHITTIPSNCFANCQKLKEIVLPNTVTKVEASAFINAYSVEKIDYSIISPSASFSSVFSNCGKNAENTICLIREGVKILDGLFNSTVYVKELYFEDISSCTKFSNNAFSGLQAGIKVYLDELAPWFSINFSESSNNCPLQPNESELYVDEELVTEIVVPESVKNIPAYCFYGYDHLTYLDCGINTESIGSYAFSYNTYLNTIYIRDKVTSFGSYPFGSCYRLKDLHYYAEQVDTTTNLFDSSTASSSGGICEITIYGQVKKIPSNCFKASSYLTKVEFKENDNAVIFGSTPFYTSNSNFKIVVARIEDWVRFVFESENCNPLSNLSTKLYVGDALYTSFEPTEDITSLGDYTFYKYKHLQNIRLHKDFSEIGTYTFIAAPSIETIFVEEENTNFVVENCVLYSIDKTKMYAITNETVQSFVLAPTLKTIPKYSFYQRTSMEEIILPDSIETIEQYAFYGCSYLEKSNLPKNLTILGEYAFYGCSRMEYFTLSSINITSVPSSGYTFYNMGSQLSSDKELTIFVSKEVTKIPDHLFRALDNSYYARIKHVIFEEDSECVEIGQYAFYYVLTLKNLVLPETITTIGNYAFYYCSALPEIILNKNLLSIGSYSFAYCTGSTQIIFNEELTTIGSYAFYNCTKINTLDFPKSLLTIGQYAFYSCNGLTSVFIPSNVATIDQYAFYSSSAWYFCELLSRPSGWNINWNTGALSRTVWGDMGTTYTYQFITNLEEVEVEPIVSDVSIVLPSLTVENKYLWGWYLTEDFSGEQYFPNQSFHAQGLADENNELILYARWEEEPDGSGSTFADARRIGINQSVSASFPASSSASKYFIFTAKDTGVYYIRTTSSKRTRGYVYNSTSSSSSIASSSNLTNSTLSFNATAGKSYVIRFYPYSSSYSAYSMSFSVG